MAGPLYSGSGWAFSMAGHYTYSQHAPTEQTLSFGGPWPGPSVGRPSQAFIGQTSPGSQSVGPVRAFIRRAPARPLEARPQPNFLSAGPGGAFIRRALAELSCGAPWPSAQVSRHTPAGLPQAAGMWWALAGPSYELGPTAWLAYGRPRPGLHTTNSHTGILMAGPSQTSSGGHQVL